MIESTCRHCGCGEDEHAYSHTQATFWCHGCRMWCDFEQVRCSCGVAAIVDGKVPDPFCLFHGIAR